MSSSDFDAQPVAEVLEPDAEIAPVAVATVPDELEEQLCAGVLPACEAKTVQLSTVERLRHGQLHDKLAGWVVTVAITALAFVIRFVNLGVPNKLVFDETYYAKDGFTLWKFGYETKWPEDANDSIAAGISDIFLTDPSYIVHPPVGKWLIGFGEQLFGMNAFGWRFMPMVFGTLLVFLVIRFARRLSRSTLVGAIAGLLLTFDGLAFLMSRMALLDIFQSVFLVAGVSCVLADRDYYRLKLAAKLEQLNLPDFGEAYGAILIWRPWRLAAGLLFGLAIGTKWNSLYVLAVMGILSVVWDVKARKLAGAGWRSGYALLTDGLPAFCYLVVVAAGVYLASWSGWLSTAGGYYRDWGAQHPDDPTVKALGVDWAALLHYHIEVFNFHTGDYMREQSHPYNAHPSGWLLMVRPTGIDWVSDVAPGVNGCVAPEGETCVQVLNGMGTPFLWWLAALALVVGLVWWIGGRDWRFGLPILAAMSTYIPWFFNADRPVFFFYSITILPFTVTLLAMVLGLALGPTSGRWRRRRGIIVGVLVGLIVANFAWIYPVLTGKTILRSEWMARMWLAFWI